jgi:hypothetical protein
MQDRHDVGTGHLGHTQGRKTGSHAADNRHPLLVESEYGHHDDRDDDRGERRGQLRQVSLEREQQRERAQPHRQRHRVGVRQLPGEGIEPLEELAVHAGHPEDLRQLGHHGDQRKTLDEALHHRLGDEVGHPSHAKQTEDEKDYAHRQRQRGRERQIPGGALAHEGADGMCRKQSGGRIRSDDQGPGGAEDSVGQERQRHGIETDDGVYAGDPGVGQRGGDHDGPHADAGQEVAAQPGELVLRKPSQHRDEISKRTLTRHDQCAS